MIYKVLIADDEPIMRKAMQTLIDWDAIGCQLVFVASSGQGVMEYLQNETPDIVILDIKMPGTSGIEIARYIYEEKLPIKVILLTAYADFSYAQHAVKYDVVDYVIKSGALDELVVAIKKAKTAIQESELKKRDKYQNILKENFFKAVFDSSLYLPEEIIERAKRIGIVPKKDWIVMVIHFSLRENKQKEYTYQNVLQFLTMSFEQQMVYGMPMKKDEMVVVLSVEKEETEKSMYDKCIQIVEMVEQFMKMDVYIGISSCSTGLPNLKKAFDEAKYAVEEGSFYETRKINYYQEIQKDRQESLTVIDSYLKDLYFYMKKGMQEEALGVFYQILESFKNSGCTTNAILDIGIEIQSICKKLLSEYDKFLYDIVPYERNISQRIYQCRHASEYIEIMTTIISNTVQYINVAVSKKNVLIYEAEKFIDENFQNGITVSEVARSVGVSLSYLSRIYKEVTGSTLINLINLKKIEKAKDYLRNTDMKIYEIAEILGFENTTYFSYFFKKNTGMSPKEYKENE